MAIKIKKKDKDAAEVESELEVGEEEVEAVAPVLGVNPDGDPFERGVTWLEKNRGLVFGLVALVFVGIIGFFIYQNQVEEKLVTASSALTPAFESYHTLVDGSPDLEQLTKLPDFPQPETTYKNETEKWQAMYDAATATLAKHSNDEVGQAARLTKAAAALGLGKADEAIEAYEAFLAKPHTEAAKGPVTQGLVTAYVTAKQYDKATAKLDELAASNDAFATASKYQKAKIFEWSGKKDEAKKLYHEILDDDPTFMHKSDVERRIATL